MIIGYDGGNINIKTSEDIIFKANTKIDDEIFIDFGVGDSSTIIFDGVRYLLEQGEFDLSLLKAKKELFLLHLYTAIAKSTSDIQNDIVIGMPIQQYRMSKDLVLSLLKENKRKEIRIGQKSRTIELNNIAILPEAVGSYYALSDDIKNRIGKRDVVIIDIGGGTTDVCILNEKRMPVLPNTIYKGVLNIYSDFAKTLNTSKEFMEKGFKPVDIVEAESIMKNGLNIYNDIVDTSQIAAAVKEKFVKTIMNTISFDYKLDRSVTILTGGGGKILIDEVRRYIPSIVHVKDIFANAKGFKRMGEIKWLGR